jgi:hypothetical protein
MKKPELIKGKYKGTDRNGNDLYSADYYLVDDVNAYIEEVEQQYIGELTELKRAMLKKAESDRSALAQEIVYLKGIIEEFYKEKELRNE